MMNKVKLLYNFIITDTGGVHGGSILNKDYRLQIGAPYVPRGDYKESVEPEYILKNLMHIR